MTKVLEKAFGEASKLSESEQNALGEWLLTEIESEREWQQDLCALAGRSG
jgi:hypothetical protein